MATAKMKPHIGFILGLLSVSVVYAQVNLGLGLQTEIFFLNLEDGYFGCQVNESTEILQLFELSHLCDGEPQCFLASDEDFTQLKCANNCPYTQGTKCLNGACLDGLCHCNDGYGGCGCDMPDENECKYRPCDVFATCTNTLGSFKCKCYPGYEGDGFNCKDIDECQNPELASKCVENAWCCNLPAHYTCKCNSGYAGDGYELCTDIDECQDPSACGLNAVCNNHAGNYTCTCPEGFIGNPYNGCIDDNECERENACGPEARCVNRVGGHDCQCPIGTQGDAYSRAGCTDIDECSSSPCAKDAVCFNGINNFTCACPPGFVGDPYDMYGACKDIDECQDNPCGPNSVCIDTIGSYICHCKEHFTGDPYTGCADIDECVTLQRPCGPNAICQNAMPSYNCICPQGFVGKPSPMELCEQVDVNVLCKSNFDCVNNAECVEGQCFCRDGFKAVGTECRDVDECQNSPCGANARCRNIPGSYACLCEIGFVGNPPETSCKAPCDGVECGPNASCETENDEAICVCDSGWAYDSADITAGCVDVDECDARKGPFGLCGENAICTNSPGSYTCQCPTGFTGNPKVKCLDVDECRRPDSCGLGALCTNTPGSFDCKCPPNTVADPDPFTQCLDIMKCDEDDDCPGNALCLSKQCMCPEPNIGDDCRHPCEDVRCGPNADCKLINGLAKCFCQSGFGGNPAGVSGCTDIDECLNNPCGQGAICRNTPGEFICECPSGFDGNPAREGCIEVKESPGCGPSAPCPSGETCILDEYVGINVCVCQRGYIRNQDSGLCQDINECQETRPGQPACGLNAICKNLPGSYDCQCPPGSVGNPFNQCDQCDTLECTCLPPYRIVEGRCVLANCSLGNKCPPGAECVTIQGGLSYCACPSGYTTLPNGSCQDIDECTTKRPDGRPPCGQGAECFNLIGSHECRCPQKATGDPYIRCDFPICLSDGDCKDNERCVQPGKCVCPPPYFMDNKDSNRCKSPCEAFSCGLNSKCTPTDPPQCMCLPGFSSTGLNGCIDIDECRNNPCGSGSVCINEIGTFRCECPQGTTGDPALGTCFGVQSSICRKNEDCPSSYACNEIGECVNPCSTLPCGANAYCEPKDHAAFCRCHPGYVKSPNGYCVSMCEGFLCGPNSNCIVSNNGPTCKCADGYAGNPFPGGNCLIDQCSPSNPCQDPQVCVNGRCKERCEGVVCGVGAKCDKNTNKCICLPFFIGDPDLLCVPPVTPPLCTPGCGSYAHCKYGQPNRCVCNEGYSGNPYESCTGEIEKIDCSTTQCGTNAQCRQGTNRVDCVCPVGFQGNPYVECSDVDECVGNACGMNAACINTEGSYDCRCHAGFTGNPFVMCMPTAPHDPGRNPCLEDPSSCRCDLAAPCPSGYTCTDGRCKSSAQCGPNAVYDDGECECIDGFSGDPTDLLRGCQPTQCRNDFDCADDQICFSVSRRRVCVDACSKVQCGINAFCIAQNHRSSCLCREGYLGDPSDISEGCTPADRESECTTNNDCDNGNICQVDNQGHKACVDPCLSYNCGSNERCYAEQGRPFCRCEQNYIRNPSNNECEKPSVPDCTRDSDCSLEAACRRDDLGVLKCVDVCRDFNCPVHSTCTAFNHRGLCQCEPGYTGNPNDRTGCRPIPLDECQSDALCSETEACVQFNSVRKCTPVCQNKECGPGAVCVASNHEAQCQCPSGLFAGDPNDMVHGCASVDCLINTDCPKHMACNRLDFTCYDICLDACGTNALCFAENHRYNCRCPPGYTPNPSAELDCKAVDVCDSNPCHSTAVCSPSGGTYQCTCPPGMVGDPHTTGCHQEGMCPNGNQDCPLDSVCMNGRCASPCDRACGPNSICNVVDRKPFCSCPPGFEQRPAPEKGCNRVTTLCNNDAQCPSGSCFDGQCKIVCRNSQQCAEGERCTNNMCMVPCVSSSQCPNDQACILGVCLIGCRNNDNCPGSQACVNNKCDDPCSKSDVCGPNALCRVENHLAKCYCPDGFNPATTAQQGCVRIPTPCTTKADCGPGTTCDFGKCKSPCLQNSDCAQGEHCFETMCHRVCFNDGNCLQGEVCVEGSCISGCFNDGDCLQNEVCISRKCMCAKGFLPGPTGCIDVDECQENPCHPSASCINVPGSFKCSCPDGTVGSPTGGLGCMAPNECDTDDNCEGEQACDKDESGMFKCVDPCASAVCGNNARCKVADRKPLCECIEGHFGDPNDLSVGCVRGECIVNEDCNPNKRCDRLQYKCFNPCDSIDCGYGRCQTVEHTAICRCERGFKIGPSGSCVDMDECQDRPCHRSATCRNTVGSYTCVCPEGQVGDPYNRGCRRPGECENDRQCPEKSACFEGKCRNPCEGPNICGSGAECRVDGRTAVCYCPPRTTGDPLFSCTALECLEHTDCSSLERSCVNNKCINPCSLPGVCGKNADCQAQMHLHVCSCKPGFTGDASLGCTSITFCSSFNDCPAQENCNGGVCVPACASNRECLTGQVCIEGSCRPTCRSSSECLDLQVCQNNICVAEVRCRANDDCNSNEECRTNAVGQAECKDICDGLVLCGRNAKCEAIDHKAVCKCPSDYFGDPLDERVGCQKIECRANTDCNQDEVCDSNVCKIACRVSNPCDDNALCISEGHKPVCFCRDGFTGDPLSDCSPIDFCSDNACGPGALCDNFRGSFKCYCPPGMVGDPFLEGCKPTVECDDDTDCPPTAYCGEEDSRPKCRDVCEEAECGPNAECEANNHDHVCVCREGYEGEPDDLVTGCRPKKVPCRFNADCPPNTICDGGLCRPPCQRDSECAFTEACVRGQCSNLCDDDDICGLNSLCTMENHRSRCTCPPGFTGNAESECFRIPSACQRNSDCSHGFVCLNGACTPSCGSDGACAQNEKCVSNMCMLTCRKNNDCFLGYICLNNVCMIGCRANEDCAYNEACQDNRCTNVCDSGNVCGANAKCSVVNHRAKCTCPEGFLPNPSANVACVRKPVSCSVNSDCPTGFICHSDTCVAICSSTDNCLMNEQCDGSVCRPVCRRDDDCRSGDICEGVLCVSGCRADSECPSSQSCINNKCQDPCQSPTTCGNNARCSVVGHHAKCECPEGMVGNPHINCRLPPRSCEEEEDCPDGMTCFSGTCKSLCPNDLACFDNERCVGGVCKEICSSDTQCGIGTICEGRLCIVGCRSDSSCPASKSCINRQCKDPCDGATTCGSCAECQVLDHQTQCTCPANTVGNPLLSCKKPIRTCTSSQQCGFGNTCEDGACTRKCNEEDDCDCSESCHEGFCRLKCGYDSDCAQGFLCRSGICIAGCRNSQNCPVTHACMNDKCIDPCSTKDPCGTNAVCRVSEHRPICLCPNGFQGDPFVACTDYDCLVDTDCERNQACVGRECKNPCLNGACGVNAQCRVVNRQAQCSCSPDYYGNPLAECKKEIDECLSDPCGHKAVCTNTIGSFTCSCNAGCEGEDPYRTGCICPVDKFEPCTSMKCGTNAECRSISRTEGECYCPAAFPNGNPSESCSGDCRQTGCGLAASCTPVAGGSFECRCRDGWGGDPNIECVPNTQCTLDTDCPPAQACINGQCKDPCSLRGACGDSALCRTLGHVAVCSCPQCYVGRPKIACRPDPACSTTSRPPLEQPQLTGCKSDADCSDSHACDVATGECFDPCSRQYSVCDANKVCEVRKHKPSCLCKHGFVVNSVGEFVCSGGPIGCRRNEDCASNLACMNNKCVNPCDVGQPCPPEKQCDVLDHRPVCICTKNCMPSVTICLKDEGCEMNQACVAYRCVDPCDGYHCIDAPCYVENHKPSCGFCPPGYTVGPTKSCVKATGCRDNSECPSNQACINEMCQNPCIASNPCGDNEDCKVTNQRPTCIAVGCRSSSSCPTNQACVNGECVSPCEVNDPCTLSERCEVMNHIPFCISACTCKSNDDCGPGLACDGCTCQLSKSPPPSCNPPCGSNEVCDQTRFVCVPATGCQKDQDCQSTQACINNECHYPCQADPCGENAECVNSDHNAQCRCRNGYQGDPLKGCTPVATPKPQCHYNRDCPPYLACDRLNRVCMDPCRDEDCAESATCHVVNHVPHCTCREGYTGNPEIQCFITAGCKNNGDCPSDKACINGLCEDPCKCGFGALCEVTNHRGVCRCPPGYMGDPLRTCRPPSNPCDADPCGEEAMCELDNGNPICFCPQGYTGNPFVKCFPDGDDCEDGSCGPNSGCRIVNGKQVCFCLPEFVGNPPSEPCRPLDDPCKSSPCGPNTDCHVVNGFHRCTCRPGFVGQPNTIRGCEPPENPCESSPCGENAYCDPSKRPYCFCRDGLVGDPFTNCREPPPTCRRNSCGNNAECYVRSYELQCRCLPGYEGDPYVHCRSTPDSPCEDNPCGGNAKCSVKNGVTAVCTCLPHFTGDPYSPIGCKPDCIGDNECSLHLACINAKCVDPCPGACGINSLCQVNTHRPVCFCPAGFYGDPYRHCKVTPKPLPPKPDSSLNPCIPPPCGTGAMCQVTDGGKAKCNCPPSYQGDPYVSCRPECISSNDCSLDMACIDRKCRDPCPGSCGINAQCEVDNHNPICFCPEGLVGDPFTHCVTAPTPLPPKTPEREDPCLPNPCGLNSYCRRIGNSDNYACDCFEGFFGTPCRPECTIDSDCPMNRACMNNKCLNPCPGSCGVDALCFVVAHKPKCRCREGYIGDPFYQCYVVEVPPIPTPCFPPCVPNAECRIVDGLPKCSCRIGYYGRPEVECKPECITNSDCPSSEACVNRKCIDPCVDSCGTNALCNVIRHNPICSCPPEYTGNSFEFCSPIPKEPVPVVPVDPLDPVPILPCDPNPCGENAFCTPDGPIGICKCISGYIGNPHTQCGPECVRSSDCGLTLACINKKCRDPCPGSCGRNAQCRVLNHQTSCVCPQGYTGNAYDRCYPVPLVVYPPSIPPEPHSCVPDPCGFNTDCYDDDDDDDEPQCMCKPGTYGDPYTREGCKPKCVTNVDCGPLLACINRNCVDPCRSACGVDARCQVVAHDPVCQCPAGYTGDPSRRCYIPPIAGPTPPPIPVLPSVEPCAGSPCGINAECHPYNNRAQCTCIEGYMGNPEIICRPECTTSSQCKPDEACVNNRCVDPCPGTCGNNAECQVLSHSPVCRCREGFTGNSYVQCVAIVRPPAPPVVVSDPCFPSPCGPNSECERRGNRPVCSCLPDFFGYPPNCRPECTLNTDCPPDKVCRNQKCYDPCPGTCGVGALCKVSNHNLICYCPEGLTGDPFVRCKRPPPIPEVSFEDPCVGNPCGPNSICQDINGRPDCRCLQGFIGLPPRCRPVCVINSDCPLNRACVNNKCIDPCKGTCGINTECRVVAHNPTCTCIRGYMGNPYVRCTLIPTPIPVETPIIENPIDVIGKPGQPTPRPEVELPPHLQPGKVPKHPCLPDPCGPNAHCMPNGDRYQCKCIPEYIGDPYSGCRPECVLDQECDVGLACMRKKCRNPCPGFCAHNALCNVVNHKAVCSCPPGFDGHPEQRCYVTPIRGPTTEPPAIEPIAEEPCRQNPCGRNAQCIPEDFHAKCVCLTGYFGDPYYECRPECTQDHECDFTKACVNEKCVDPCPGSCGLNAECQVVTHSPVCYCKDGYVGDPYTACRVRETTPAPPVDPCNPSPCGPNSECREVNGRPDCLCLDGYFGRPPDCRPECVINPDCSTRLACIGLKCRDPCPGTCGINAQCEVIKHNPICSCPSHMTGDPFVRCFLPPTPQTPTQPPAPCNPSPCGPNAECKPVRNRGVCTCIEGHQGNPYQACRPECLINPDCSKDKACLKQRCVDPCPGTCGIDALCYVVNHNPICYCPDGMKGDPFIRCKKVEVARDPCNPTPCGAYTNCRVTAGRPVCSCIEGYQDDPIAGCRPECTINSDCSLSKACINKKCVNPCPAPCGRSAVCNVVSHNPVCSCPPGYFGNPFIECKPKPTVEEPDPCNPDPCGVNADCRVRGNGADCRCYPGYYGNPYVECKPECVINQDCPKYRACLNQKCVDPCPGTCGINAVCDTINHQPVCTCPRGYTGQPFVECTRVVVSEQKPECLDNNDCNSDKACVDQKCKDPCKVDDPCAPTAECHPIQHRPVCVCPLGQVGDPYSLCLVVGCRDDSECTPLEACINQECEDPCKNYECGENALCRVVNRKPKCYCPPEFLGNPYVECRRPECLRDPDCPTWLACINEECEDPCNCGPHAECQVINHRAQCSCPRGYTGDPYISCEPEPEREPTAKECLTDAECPSRMACLQGRCDDPCHVLKPCGTNAECRVIDTLPYRTMVCECLPGFFGNAYVICEPKPTDPPGCRADDECKPIEVCRNGICEDPCALYNPCAPNAECRVINRLPKCFCPPDYTGNPALNCYPIPIIEPDCRVDPDCPLHLACVDEHCVDPCVIDDPCGTNARCHTKQHRPTCFCDPGWIGDPYERCYKPDCLVPEDCPFDKTCINEVCVDPCIHEGCGDNALCNAILHRAQCYCPLGMQGNPNVACVTVGCRSNDDCPTDKACDYNNGVCINVCTTTTCAPQADCRGINHAALCTCPPGYEGNPFTQCYRVMEPTTVDPIEPECRKDPECPSQHACINELCVQPCVLSDPCLPEQECRLIDELPLRTVVCECPNNAILMDDNTCKLPKEEGCRVDEDCMEHEACRNGVCAHVCRPYPCGLNALCIVDLHRSDCQCPPGFTGDPLRQCKRVPLGIEPQPECEENDDCPEDMACSDKTCKNLCGMSDSCADEAFCFMANHQPVCRCPSGYRGDPKIKCEPLELPVGVGCRADNECPTTEACINKHCVIPCNCGPNAECRVINHRPICTCQAGFDGNPNIGCFEVGCKLNEECPLDKACHEGVCVDPCYIRDPCALNAECYAEVHEAKCRCPTGMEGDPFIRCILVGCRSNPECPEDKACINRQCADPCLYTDICAPNALCYVSQHTASCRCPPELSFGDPLFMCEEKQIESKEPVPECYEDKDCPSQHACIESICRNPCYVLDPCHDSATCMVIDSLPVRTMTCVCPAGYIMTENEECALIELEINIGCAADSECPEEEACINRRCRDPCHCGSNAECIIIDHRPICRCQAGFQGNPNIGCYPIGCTVDQECDDDKACYDGVCANPCLVNDPCAINAECYATDHRAMCRCAAGLMGDGYTECITIGCRDNSDCPTDRACINKQCEIPCVHDDPCSTRADCINIRHEAKCRCPQGMTGDPRVNCEPIRAPVCVVDSDCPRQTACLEEHCQNPCTVLDPCDETAICRVVDTEPYRTMICVCPDGMLADSNGACELLPPIKPTCEANDECPSDKACFNGFCKEPCLCGANANCEVIEHHPVCSCVPGYEGDPEIACYDIGCSSNDDCPGTHACQNGQCAPVCGPNNEPCGEEAICQGVKHKAVCYCPPGSQGNPRTQCLAIGCTTNSICPDNRGCINQRCLSPCTADPCEEPAECRVENHQFECPCPPGYNGTKTLGCEKIVVGCRSDSECPSKTACINLGCMNPCDLDPCGENAECRVVDTLPVRTISCVCIEGYQGDAAVKCLPTPACPLSRGFILNDEGRCVCPIDRGFYVDSNDNCARCPVELGFILTPDGFCICDPSKGYVLQPNGECGCPPPAIKNDEGECVLVTEPPIVIGCTNNDDCPDDRTCDRRSCVPPCGFDPCAKYATCINRNHTAICNCVSGYSGNAYVEDGCVPTFARTDFPRPDMVVNCLADGVQVDIQVGDPGFNGVLYVKGYSKNEECRRVVKPDVDVGTIDFKVRFNTCGLVHENGIASFILVIQKHPKLMTYKAQAYNVKCTYNTGDKTITIGFNVSMLTTAGTIANTGPPPTCYMKIISPNGNDIQKAEIGDLLMLQITVEPSSIYGGFARNCIALTSEDNKETEYEVTDDHGCATDPAIFGEWELNRDSKTLAAVFHAFKFPSSNSIRFQCNVRVCFGRCQPINCNGYDAYGKRRRRQAIEPDAETLPGKELTLESQLREIRVSSNAIFTVERRTDRLTATEPPPETLKDEVCVSKWGFIIALIITTLLALVAVAVAVSCWLMAYRRRPRRDGPLPHPPEFPNPLFTTPEPLAEPSPDYLS